ncbi:MAG TPA: FAD-dependent monooxygenase [Chryseosolibacter sp.]|nr:FAD-dependent monooxygenase [Chryseosolibacter sp.]
MKNRKKFAVVGAGIGGLSVAIALQRRGFDVTVVENAPAIKTLGAGLVLAANAIKAFTTIGISNDVLQSGKALKALRIKDPQGNVIHETDSEKLSEKLGLANTFAIHRADLHAVLMARLSPGTVQLNKGCVDYWHRGSATVLEFHDGSSLCADYVIACDGIHSALRKKLLPHSHPRYSGYTCWRAVVEIDPGIVNMEETTETWGKGKRFGIVPLAGNRVYWFACANSPPGDPRMQQMTVAGLQAMFSDFHEPVRNILSRTADSDLIWSDILDIRPIGRFAFGNIVLLGDAAHATTPNMGQGACMAIEDAAVLANCLQQYEPEHAFSAFEKKRIARTTAIVNQSRRIGQVAQLENSLLIGLRNLAMKNTPRRFIEKQANFIAGVTLD